jgi:hypothetical protein
MFCQIFVATIQRTTIKILLHLSDEPNRLILPYNGCGKHLTLGVAGNKQTHVGYVMFVLEKKHHHIYYCPIKRVTMELVPVKLS